MGFFAKTPKTKGGSNNNNLKINITGTVLTEIFLFLKYGGKFTLTEPLSIQETAIFLQLILFVACGNVHKFLQNPSIPLLYCFTDNLTINILKI